MKPVDPEELEFGEGEYLVRISRTVVEAVFEVGPETVYQTTLDRVGEPSEKLRRPGASFVTIEHYSNGKRSLRGCIGYIRPIKPLFQSTMEVALQAAFSDPRFPPLTRGELDKTTFEVSVLSEFEEAPKDVEGRLDFVKIGRDGLYIEHGFFSGLLLPQVPVEYGWTEEEFLDQTCIKAGLPPSCWRKPEVKVFRFRARLWRESYPRGPVEERDLRAEWESIRKKARI
ncbi:MAG: AmmeMemoRadiSam system protein A [Desulfurococcales archaeon]|nr:AmmeMemoRadiSam system protein A [Desulfurococcales archaeon]